MDTPPEAGFNNIVFTVAQIFRASIAMLNLVDDRRSWAKALVGPIMQSQARNDTFCRVVIETGQDLLVEDAAKDPRFSAIPCVAHEPHVRFFIGAPLLGPGKHVIGALCALDRHPRTIRDAQQMQLRQLALQAGELLRLRVPGLDLYS